MSSPFAADPMNPTDAELAAAIERGIADGTFVLFTPEGIAEMVEAAEKAGAAFGRAAALAYYAEQRAIHDREPTDEEVFHSAEPHVPSID